MKPTNTAGNVLEVLTLISAKNRKGVKLELSVEHISHTGGFKALDALSEEQNKDAAETYRRICEIADAEMRKRNMGASVMRVTASVNQRKGTSRLVSNVVTEKAFAVDSAFAQLATAKRQAVAIKKAADAVTAAAEAAAAKAPAHLAAENDAERAEAVRLAASMKGGAARLAA